MSFTPEQQEALKAWTTKYPYKIMGLVEALRSVQDWRRCVSLEDQQYLADLFGVSISHVHGVATFFPSFTKEPTGKYRVGLCHGLSCAMRGAKEAAEALEKTLGVPEGTRTADGLFSWEEMECLGACDQAPALLVNDELQGEATEGRIKNLKKELR